MNPHNTPLPDALSQDLLEHPATAPYPQEIASAGRDVTFAAFGGWLRIPDDTLLQRGGVMGYRAYDEIEKDPHAFAVVQKRKMGHIAREFYIQAGGPEPRDKALADLTSDMLVHIFDQACLDLLDALLKGFAVAEVMWEARKDQVWVREIKARDQRRFAFDEQGALVLKTPENPYPGVLMPPRKFLVHSFGGKDGNPYGVGLGQRLYFPTYFKRQGVSWWLAFVEKYGSPTAVGEYPPSTSPDDQKKLLDALTSLSQEAGVIVPQGMAVRLLEAQRSGALATYESLVRYMDEQISEAVLGETLTTHVGGTGSLAAGQVHNNVRLEVLKADSDLLCGTLNRTLLAWIRDFNDPLAAVPRVYRDFRDLESLAIIDRDLKLHQMGFSPSPEYVKARYADGWVVR